MTLGEKLQTLRRSRGLSQEQTEALFLSAKLEEAALTAPTDEIRAHVIRLGNQIIPDFEEEIA